MPHPPAGVRRPGGGGPLRASQPAGSPVCRGLALGLPSAPDAECQRTQMVAAESEP